jgi:hypothetical protein
LRSGRTLAKAPFNYEDSFDEDAMTKPERKRNRDFGKSEQLGKLRPVNPNAAGIDIGATSHWVCVPPDRDSQLVREFRCFTTDLYALADWLHKCKIETVVMEPTGVYWVPLFQILETRGLKVFLVNSQHVKSIPGRKSGMLDCQWLQQLHTYGLLAGSFPHSNCFKSAKLPNALPPENEIYVLRSYIRQRNNLNRSAATYVQRMQKALTEMNLQLHRVISDITGKTGIAIIRALLKF